MKSPLKSQGGGEFTVFTTRADTLYGCTYVVISPEHPLVDQLTTPENKAAVEEYKEYAAARFARSTACPQPGKKPACSPALMPVNPINGRAVPIWMADYVLASYGTGVVMAVPAHDERDFEFATKYNLPIERVIAAKEERRGRQPALYRTRRAGQQPGL